MANSVSEILPEIHTMQKFDFLKPISFNVLLKVSSIEKKIAIRKKCTCKYALILLCENSNLVLFQLF